MSTPAISTSPRRVNEDKRSSNDLVHPIVLWVVTIWSKVKTTATTTAGALMRDATDEMPTVYRDTAAELSRHQPM